MLKKFKGWYQKVMGNRRDIAREEAMDIKNHEITIRDTDYFVAKAMFTDIPEMLGIERAVYSGQTPWDETAFANELHNEQHRLYLVIRRHDRLLAFIGCSFDERHRDAHITNIAVVPDFQNRGLGRFLLSAMVKKARSLDYRTVSLEVRLSNTKAQQLYADLGFERTGIKRGYYFGDHEDAIDMTLQLMTDGDDDAAID